jgi:hypothetical protein
LDLLDTRTTDHRPRRDQNKTAKGFHTTDVPCEFHLLAAEVGEAFSGVPGGITVRRRVVRILTWTSVAGMLLAGVAAGLTGHPWVAAGFAAGVLGQLARVVLTGSQGSRLNG